MSPRHEATLGPPKRQLARWRTRQTTLDIAGDIAGRDARPSSIEEQRDARHASLYDQRNQMMYSHRWTKCFLFLFQMSYVCSSSRTSGSSNQNLKIFHICSPLESKKERICSEIV